MQSDPLVMVIDDEPVVLGAMQRILSSKGIRTVAAPNAEEGLELLAREAPQIVIVDLKLPGMSGIEMLDQAKVSHPSVIVIVASGFSSVDQSVASLAHGAFDFLPKPFTYDELLSPVQRAMRYLEVRDRLEAPPANGGAPLLTLGPNAWARCEEDGSVRLGLSRVFIATTSPLASVRLPREDDMLWQGGRLAAVEADDGASHIAWAAMGGRVVAINRELEHDVTLLAEDPFDRGWIAIVRAISPEADLAHLRTVE